MSTFHWSVPALPYHLILFLDFECGIHFFLAPTSTTSDWLGVRTEEMVMSNKIKLC